ncbi:MAG: extracellular solute-binding protein, partial [Thiotrichales bacterium]|nr:extracellular solute-binding protein [Thiotrichales bacterium]
MRTPIRRLAAATFFAVAASASPALAAEGLTGAHALSMFDDVKYGPDFEHFDYTDPNAPTGGAIRLAALGTFDSLNPFILKGNVAAGSGLIYDSLLTGSLDEPFTEYGLLVESIDMPTDRSWVEFTLREEARWHDGRPVTVEDVIWTTETLKTKGHPFYRHYYADIAGVSQAGPRTVRFAFGDTLNRELPLIVGQIQILPKHWWEGRDFESTTLEPPPGSGPYRIAAVEPGRSITYERVPDYWGRNLAVQRGQNNIDAIRYDYYRDATVAVEAFKAGEFDFRHENNSKEWGTAYDLPDVESGRIIKELIDHEIPTGMQAFWFNTRRAKFADPRVRHALAHAFDFEWSNANLFYGQYTRTKSFFSNTELASSELPEGTELEILERWRDRLPAEVFARAYEPPSTDGSGNIRRNLRTAKRLLQEAGWTVHDGVLTHAGTGETMEIEFLLVAPAFERIVAPVVRNMERLGIAARIRLVDPAQYQNRTDAFDFDIVVSTRGQSLSPGNEQRNYWTTASADIPGSGNLAGIADPVVDALVDLLIQAPDRDALVATTRALDRVLLWGHYVIPQWHIRSFRLVYWNKFGRPEIRPKYGLGFPSTWWIDEDKAARLEA